VNRIPDVRRWPRIAKSARAGGQHEQEVRDWHDDADAARAFLEDDDTTVASRGFELPEEID
jgi:hypothetical protein